VVLLAGVKPPDPPLRGSAEVDWRAEVEIGGGRTQRTDVVLC
jgi:hypothetical protein